MAPAPEGTARLLWSTHHAAIIANDRTHGVCRYGFACGVIPTLSADESVAIAMVPRESSREARTLRARELLTQVGLEHRFGHLPSRLSGGEQQRVAIARALANSPEVVVADEPIGNLDSSNAQEFMALLHDLQQRLGVTIVIATHDEEISSHTERRIRLRDGVIVPDSRN